MEKLNLTSQKIDSFLSKRKDGWYIQTDFDISETQFLRVSTSKSGRIMQTLAAVNTRTEQNSIMHMVFVDFFKVVKKEQKICNQKNIVQQHTDVLNNIEELKQEAKNHYNKK